MKIAVTGWEGTIGSELVDRGYEPLKCDVTNLDEVNAEIHRVEPDVIIHCAAMTNVTWCEQEENQQKAFSVNVNGVHNILHDFSGTLIYLSTVHVFDGKRYWDYSERHSPSPVNTYGFTKWAGEEISKFNPGRTVVIRISKLFDYAYMKPDIERLQRGEELEFTTLIKRSFQHVSQFVDNLTWFISVMHKYPDIELLNIAGKDTFSYYDFWVKACKILGLDEKLVTPRTHKIEDTPRPFRGGLSIGKAQKIGMKAYSAVDGLKLIKQEMR